MCSRCACNCANERCMASRLRLALSSRNRLGQPSIDCHGKRNIRPFSYDCLVDEFVLETSFKLARLLFRRAGREPSKNTMSPLLELDGVALPSLCVFERADR